MSGGEGHLRKRSFRLAGHRTSVALEPAFWSALEAMAAGRGTSLAGLVAAIDAGRTDLAIPLSSALRVEALRAACQGGMTAMVDSDPAPLRSA
ncbi:ribbon-helix-helix domain-containing protein [Falsiroseomonas ponticola]|jgi:predicted DNA-binding ribbon-helix-helix protein|uniref:ribbon-helix-helix domain-containing protein n=1 Tax=Falsiroseomonas ponticola TaxID=2786951 RepID=UPI0019322F22|nr:ribbon-helix-helix domain-containing protein [Roseomonas ponticola]